MANIFGAELFSKYVPEHHVLVLAFFLHRYVERPNMDWARKLTLNAPVGVRR